MFKEKAILLKTTRYRDADLIVEALTAGGERLSLLARAALKSRKRFGGGVLEPTHYVQLHFDRAPGEDSERLHTLKEAQLLHDFSGLRADYDRLQLALYLVRVVGQVSRHGIEARPSSSTSLAMLCARLKRVRPSRASACILN